MSKGGRARAGRGLYSEVQCIMGNGHMGPPPQWTESRTDMSENIIFPQLRGRAVMILKYQFLIRLQSKTTLSKRRTAASFKIKVVARINFMSGEWL